MYGLLIDSIEKYIKDTYGDHNWREIQKHAKIECVDFSFHKQYPESTIADIAKATAEVTGEDLSDLMDNFGVSFVKFVSQYGYDKILKVLGRNMRDFLNGLDNLHEYLRFTYPKISPPSFFVEKESKVGLTLHYRSKRKGYLNYVKGQIRQVGRMFYNTKVDIEVIREISNENLTHVIMRLHFDNTAFEQERISLANRVTQSLPIRSEIFFELFPFHVVFNEALIMKSLGSGLRAVMPPFAGKSFKEFFHLMRPLVEFSWDSIMAHTNSVFEILSKRNVIKPANALFEETADKETVSKDNDEEKSDAGDSYYSRDGGVCLHLKGQMLYMSEWDMLIFLATPVMENLESMFKTGLYINDLSMHDSSRELVLAGTQQSAELKLALDQEQQKSKILEESMRKLDEEMKRTDELLYQMIPKAVADRLRSGEPAINTCQVFGNVTILFSDVVGFTTICSKLVPMEVVSMLNAMYTKFDQLSEKHHVYKVETIGDAYMIVAGAPEPTPLHAENTCNMALDMLISMSDLKDPSTGGNMKIRVGIHSGTTVAGVVGIKMPRYCLFGDTVNTASRMETNGEMNKIHISETTQSELPSNFLVQERGTIYVKGKGEMKTFWLLGRDNTLAGSGSNNNALIPGNDIKYTNNTENNIKCPSQSTLGEHDKRSIYSPVSFEDVRRRMSHQSTPHDSPSKGCPAEVLEIRLPSESKHIEDEKIVSTADVVFKDDNSQNNGNHKDITLPKNGKNVSFQVHKNQGDLLDMKSQTCHIL